MLKFFHKYMKYILVGIVSLLMIAFLIQGAMQWLVEPNQSNITIGQIGDTKIKVGDEQAAQLELNLLKSLALPPLSSLAEVDRMAWLLIQRDARAMGLSASQYEVSTMLQSMGMDKATLPAFSAALGGRHEQIQTAIRNWLIARQYEELIYGLAHIDLNERLDSYQQFSQFGHSNPYLLHLMLTITRGHPRLSEPVIRHFLSDRLAKVRIKAIKIDSSRHMAQLEPPTEQTLLKLFESHKDHLPDEGQIGYRSPDQIQLEYLSIPIDRIIATIDVSDADAMTYYDNNREDYRVEPDSDSPQEEKYAYQEYDQVRDQIMSKLRQGRASQLGRQMIKAAQAMLMDQVQSFPKTNGYYDRPTDWLPMSLTEVAKALQLKFGILVDVVLDDSRWLDRNGSADLPGIGQSHMVIGREVHFFVDYAFSTQEISNDKKDLSLALMRLQTKLPSQMLINSSNRNLYCFRLVNARPNRIPQSLDEVREKVIEDANQQAAYEKLIAEKQIWVEKLKTYSLDQLAHESGETIIEPAPFAKQMVQGVGDGLTAPEVEKIGRSQTFVDRVFRLAQKVVSTHGLDGVVQAGATEVIPLPEKTSLVLISLESYTPITRSEYVNQSRQSLAGHLVYQSLQSGIPDPMSYQALVKRTGFVPEDDGFAATSTSPTNGP